MKNIQALVISLPQSIERKEKITIEMSETNLNWKFIDAVDGAKLDLYKTPYNPGKVKRLLGFELTRKEIGCYLSHMNAWKICVESKKETIIFEDDFTVKEHFQAVVKTLTEEYDDWQAVRLQALGEVRDSVIKDFGRYQLVRNYGDPLGATAYLIKPSIAQIFIENSIEIFEPLDHFIENHFKHGIKMTAIKPYPIEVFEPTGAISTINDRPERKSIRGFKKIKRSFFRLVDRKFSKHPWFKK